MMQKKRGLGRGLGELLGDVSAPAVEKPQDVQKLPIEFLQRGKYQPRKDMDPEKLKELADSIAAQGIIQPIIVRKIDGEKFEIIAGERRWRAAQLAELAEVPVLLKDIDDRSVMAIALIENIQREDLNALEEAEALHRLQNEFELTHQQIAEAVGKSRTTVTNLLRLLELATDVKTMLGKGQLEMGHARALLGLDEARQIYIAHKAVKQGLTVRAVEKMVRELQSARTHHDQREVDPDILRLQRELGDKVGARVEIQHQPGGKGRLIVSYASLEELDGIIQKFRVD